MKKILLYLIAILTPFIFISNVKAESSLGWFENDTDKQQFVNVDAYNWGTYPSSYESLAISPAMVYTRIFTDSTGSVVDESWGGIKTDSSVNVYTQGVSFTFQPNIRFMANYLYSLTFYVCNSVASPFNATATIQKSNTSALTANMVYTYTNRNSVSNVLASEQVSCPYAYAYTSLVVPEVNGNYIAYRFTSSTSIRSQFLLLGYEIKELGIYNESLEASLTNIINSSGLATAKSINEVKSSISTMSSEITSAQNETNNKLDDANNALSGDSSDESSSSCGVICKLKNLLSYINPLSEKFFAYKLVELLIDALKSLIVPDDMSFVTDFVDALESKLGFIGTIPAQVIEFAINLVSASWTEFKSISFPSISIFGYNFWNSQEIDLTEAINIFKPFKYVTDCICVVLCVRTLNKWREQFTGGSSE